MTYYHLTSSDDLNPTPYPNRVAAEVARDRLGKGFVLDAARLTAARADTPSLAEAPEARIERQIAHATSVGFGNGFADAGNLFFPPGHKLAASGKQAYTESFDDWAGQPLMADSLIAISERIEAEKRIGVVVDDPRTLSMNEKGEISRNGRDWLPIEEEAFSKLCGLLWTRGSILKRAGHYLASVPADLRAENFNRQVADSFNAGVVENADGTTTPVEPKALKLLGRVNPETGSWSIFGAVGPTYPEAWANLLLRKAVDELGDTEYRGAGMYDPATTQVSVHGTLHAPIDLDARVGDVFKGGVNLRTNDRGGGGIKLGMDLVRVRCVNLTTIEAYLNLMSRRHVGKVDSILADFDGALGNVNAAFGLFARDWNLLRDTPVTGIKWGRMTFASVPDALEALVEKGEIGKGLARDTAVAAMLQGFSAEKGDSLADLINAVSRAAWESTMNAFQREAWERDAGALVPVLAGYARKGA